MDDDEPSRAAMTALIKGAGHKAVAASTVHEARASLSKERPDVVVLDVSLHGVELLERLRSEGNDVCVIVVSAVNDVEWYKNAMSLRACDYLVKPADPDVLLGKIALCLTKINNGGPPTSMPDWWTRHGIVGDSAALLSSLRAAESAASANLNVLITGDSGVGKEKFARLVHNLSPRSKKRFVAVNCAAIDHALFNAELFGYRKGAFTGADADRPGLIREADGGTLFLDEIGDLGREAQMKLLRVMETRDFYPVGDTRIQMSDVRFVTATHHELTKDVGEGRFRLDFFYRLKGFEIRIPPLRERTEDISLLVGHFLSNNPAANDPEVHPAVLDAMTEYDWPGNVRQLENMVAVAVAMAKGGPLNMSHFPELAKKGAPKTTIKLSPRRTLDEDVAAAERKRINEVLNFSVGNTVMAAELLGINRATLYRKIKKYGMPLPTSGQPS